MGYGCLATGPANNSLEYVKTDASHTYYTVVSGDSWWSDCQTKRPEHVYVSITKR
ncbi:Lysin [Lactiplantibacillus plantarum]|uniref:Lysin n=1 Tax=Lactiplantibacillus plantarum TaxID=1590 RepID=A0AAW3RJX8_LACPN|nr:Lysin [Lactiplantibacillus plantarum]